MITTKMAIPLQTNRKLKQKLWKKLLIFLLFQMLFTCLTFPALVFYGPFENVKNTIVGMSMNSLRHQYIAKLFLSDQSIQEIMRGSAAVDPTQKGEAVNTLQFGVNHSDKIEVYDVRGKDFVGKLMVVYDPTSIVIGLSELLPKSGETTSVVAKRNQAVAAINAGGFMDKGWTGTGGVPMGFVIHDGEVAYNQQQSEEVKQDTVAFTKEGMLIVGRHSIAQLKGYGVKEAVSFGPPLIVNGKPTIASGDGGWGFAPRTAIGQRENGEVLMLVIDGRSFDSFGATLKDAQDILMEYGAVNAVNLDGGSSSTMVLNDKVINKPSDRLGERAVPSVFLVAPGKGGESN